MSDLAKARHPKGLYLLFFTEMWERFGFYLLLGILALYMEDTLTGGLGFSGSKVNDIYGTYIALVYLTPFIGGLLADRILGYRRTIVIGGALMGLGYSTLFFPGETPFYIALTLIICGNGLFKPNISTLLGNLYNKPEYVALKSKGYNIFYMGINIGAFVCNFVAAYLRNEFGWGFAFLAAGIGMFIGLGIFLSGQNRIKDADVLKPKNPEDMPMSQIILRVFAPALVFAAIGFLVPGWLGMDFLLSKATIAFLLACIPVTFFYLRTYTKASIEDRKPVGSLLYIFAVVVVFWMVFHQNGNVLTKWSEDFTKREVPASWVTAGDSLLVDKMEIIQEVDSKVKLIYVKDDAGNFITGAKALEMSGTKLPKEDMPSFTPELTVVNDTLRRTEVRSYFYNHPRDQWPPEGENHYLLNTEILQSLNPGFVILFTPLVLAFFSFLARRKREPSTPAKIAWGLFITGLSTFVMVMAVTASDNGVHKVSVNWLVATYAVITIGELFLSPMGLSLVSKLAPARLTALLMGGWFLSTSIGNKLAGVLGSLNTAFDDKRIIFLINFAGAMLCALLLFAAVKKIRQVVKDKTGHY